MTALTKTARQLRQNMTQAEGVLWFHLKNRQLKGFKFSRQVPIEPYIVDFICRAHKFVVEVDGGHHADNAQDAKRTAFLNSKGYSVLRFWNHEVLEHRQSVLQAILDVLETGTPSPDLRFAPATLSPTGRGKTFMSRSKMEVYK